MTYKTVSAGQPHFTTLSRGYNLRWPAERQEPAHVLICRTEDEIRAALKHALADPAVKKGIPALNVPRVTVRSGGHCYEGFVSNNPRGYIIDVGEYAGLHTGEDALPKAGDYEDPGVRTIHRPEEEQIAAHFPRTTHPDVPRVFKVLPGTQNWDGYVSLYKRHGKTIPGGSCYSVGAGGHISGGGYGLLSRMHGLTTDWLTAVDVIIAPDGETPVKVFASENINPELFRMCAGAGGGNVGIITAFYFRDLPTAPEAATLLIYTIPWKQFRKDDTPQAMENGKVKFRRFLKAYSAYFEEGGEGAKPEAHGLFTLLHVTHHSNDMSIAIQFCPNKAGDPDQYAVLNTFVQTMNDALDTKMEVRVGLTNVGHAITPGHPPQTRITGRPSDSALEMDWLAATQYLNDSGAIRRGTYKSAYLKHITDTYADGLYDQLGGADSELFTVDGPNKDDRVPMDVSDCVVQIDSYGGAINTKGRPADAVFQRGSALKVQYHGHWYDQKQDDTYHLWFTKVFTASFAGDWKTTPFPYHVDETSHEVGAPSPAYEGCYINYPDVDMLGTGTVKVDGNSVPAWMVLYYGEKNPAKLILAKAMYDPHNVFRHQMSIPTSFS